MKKSAREATAYHEAGHMAAAWRLRLKICRATIVPSDDFAGIVEHESPLKGINLAIDSSDRAEAKTDKAVLICLAGPIAQRRFRPKSWRRYHGRGDYELASDFALRRNGTGEMASAYLKWMELRAETLVEANWRFVDAFARRLLAQNTLSYAEIGEIVTNEINARYGGQSPVFRISVGLRA